MPLDIVKYTGDFFKLPGPTLKKRWVGEYEAVTVHTLGKKPTKLIGERRPYEDEDIKKYRNANYVPITRGPFTRFLTNLQRVFSAAQVTIDTGNETLQEFITGPNFSGMDLRSYWARRLAVRGINDPNGVLVRWVGMVPAELNQRVTPELHLVLCKNIVHFTQDVFTWKSGEKSMVLAPDPAGGQEHIPQPLGTVYYIVTDQEYWKYVQVGKQSDNTFDMILWYRHGLGRFPIDIIGGEETSAPNEKTNEEEAWMQTFVVNAMPYADECARQWSDHQGVLIVSGFPLREMTPVNCSYEGCVEGWVKKRAEGSDEVQKVQCPNCKGRGKIPPFGPYGVLLRERAGVLSGGAKPDDKPMVEFRNPDPDILRFGGETWRGYKADLEKELNLLFIEEQQSGKAKEIDREDKVAKLDQLGHHLFMVLMKRTIIDFGDLMFAPVKEETLNITLPPTFTVRTEDELNLEMEGARKGEQPTPTVATLSLEYNKKRFVGNRAFIKQVEILMDYDPLYGMTAADVAAAQAGGVVDSVLVRRHTLAFTALRRMVREKTEAVLDAPDVFTLLDAAIEELMPQQRIDDELDKDAEREQPPVPPGGGGFGGKGGSGKKEPPPEE